MKPSENISILMEGGLLSGLAAIFASKSVEDWEMFGRALHPEAYSPEYVHRIDTMQTAGYWIRRRASDEAAEPSPAASNVSALTTLEK